jgi:hypothetical protein
VQKTLESVGFLVMVAGVVGIINHFWDGWRLFNLVNGVLLRHVESLQPYELYVDVSVAVLGLVILLAASSLEQDHA